MLTPRWQKIWSDLWDNKARTALMILSLTAGVLGVGVILNTRVILDRNMTTSFAAVNPASATLVVDGLDETLVKAVRRMPEIAAAEGRRVVTTRLRVGPDQWFDLDLYAIDDYEAMPVNRVQPNGGAWPPAKGQLLLERSAKQLPELAGFGVGDQLVVQTSDDKLRTLDLAGLAFDFNQTPAAGANRVYGYITPDTLAGLGQPRTYNQLSFIVAENGLDETHIRQVADGVTDKLEKSGRSVYTTLVPPPGEHPLQRPITTMLFILGTLGSLSLLSSGFLVVNMISALLTQQIGQIGLMKAIGARSDQVIHLYVGLIFILNLLALAIAIPLAVGGAYLLANFIASLLNLDLTNYQIPFPVFIAQVAIGLVVPMVAAFYAIRAGTRVTVREAISDYGLGRQSIKPDLFDRSLSWMRNLPPLIILIWRNLFRRKKRLALTLITLSLSGALFITVASARASLLGTLDNSFVYRTYDLQVSFKRPYRVDEIEGVALGTPGIVKVESFNTAAPVNRLRPNGGESDNLVLYALPDESELFRPPVVRGRWLHPQERQGLVINTTLLRDEPDLTVGDEIVLQFEKCRRCDGVETIRTQETIWQIVGIVDEAMAPPTVYVNNSAFIRVAGGVGRATAAWLRTGQHQTELVAGVAEAVERQFEAADLRIGSTKTIRAQYEAQAFHFNIMVLVLMAMAVLLAVVGGLGLMGTMSINVIERIREIGIMRTIGASNGTVFQVFIVEGLLVSLLSWPLGVLLALLAGPLLSGAIERLMELTLIYTFALDSIILWLVIVLLIAALASLLPARSAMQLSVREVLAYN